MGRLQISYIDHRNKAYVRQSGRCFYCGCHMWLGDHSTFTKIHSITSRQAKSFQCTAEHLIAKQDGGRNIKSNIVAACLKCNLHRHKAKNPMAPTEFKLHVTKLIEKGHWRSGYDNSSGLLAPIMGKKCRQSVDGKEIFRRLLLSMNL